VGERGIKISLEIWIWGLGFKPCDYFLRLAVTKGLLTMAVDKFILIVY